MRDKLTFCWVFLLTVVAMSLQIFAQDLKEPLSFTTHTQVVGPLKAKFEPLPVITESAPQKANFVLENRSDKVIDCSLVFSSVDTITPINDAGENVLQLLQKVTIPAQGKFEGAFDFRILSGTYNAHYPLHLKAEFLLDGQPAKLHIVRVIETMPTGMTASGNEFKETVIREGGVSLLNKNYIAFYNYLKEEQKELGANWSGTEPQSRASLSLGNHVRGQSRRGFNLHPPYNPKAGNVWLQYPIQLPVADKVTLAYASAMRDITATEPPSDGVTFRFWVVADGQERKLAAEHHETNRTWTDHLVDLSPWSGKRIDLSIEVNPGPKGNTACDGCYLSGLVITGTNGSGKTFARTEKGKTFTIPLANEMTAVVTSGEKGLFDSTFAIIDNKTKKALQYDGFSLDLDGQPLEGFLPLAIEGPDLVWDETTKKLTSRVVLLVEDQRSTVSVAMYPEKGMLMIDVPAGNPAKIGPLTLKGSQAAFDRVYFGHGYVIERPLEPFTTNGGGHHLSTSHVGFDYDNGLSLLLGTNTPPRRFFVDPAKKIASLEVTGVAKLALLPTDKGAFQAAFDYRSRCPWYAKPSAGVARKAGRLVFDVWGGRYADNTAALNKVFAYGVTDSLFIKHVWQKWGYDVRLPDIWDADSDVKVLADLGTFDELTELVRTCTSRGVPFALHDNYIDYYPDAEDFSYKYITFNPNGQPRKAWINHGKGVQSYQWRPDLFRPFLDRNLAIGKKLIPEVDAYFVDVFTSTTLFDFYSQEGEFFPQAVTQKGWKECFETIGETLAHTNAAGKKETAITISEAASDFLIGSIDGSDAQWMLLSSGDKPWSIKVPCEKWERTPWFAAVNHTNFSRHGAGYPDRYAGLRNNVLHGPQSDDYICSEILGGLEMMVSLGDVFPGSVRKHWLAQHVVRRLADQEITAVEFVENDIYRQIITWSDGTKVFANRGEADWKLPSGEVLPMYGFAVLDKQGKFLSGIVSNPQAPNEVVERSCRGDSFYLNGRGNTQQNLLPITPSLDSFETMDNGQFKVKIKWEADQPTADDLNIFIHVYESYRGYGHQAKGWVAGGYAPVKPTSQWAKNGSETIVTNDGAIMQVPSNLPSGTYHIMVGLGSLGMSRMSRFALIGEDAKEMRYSIASLRVNRRGDNVQLEIKPIELSEPRAPYLRLLGNQTPVKWRGISTLGAISVTPTDKGLQILPLPTLLSFDVAIDEKEGGKKITAVSCQGTTIPFETKEGVTIFRVEAKDAQVYDVHF